MRRAIMLSLACLAPTLAAAQAPSPGTTPAPIVTHVQTAADLAAVCDPAWSGVPRLEAIAYCQGFLTSAGQYHTLLHPVGGRQRRLYCLPSPGPSIADSGVDFAAWTRANPGVAGEPALDGLLRWAQARFPCPPVTAAARPAR